MTAENNGTGPPGDDDPFAYLYRPEGGGAEGGAASAQQPGVPRRSYNQVRAVGERQYGAQGGQGYGYPPAHTARQPGAYPQQGANGAAPGGVPGQAQGPSAHYAAPETMPGGRAALRQQGGAGGPGGARGPRGGGGGNRNGLLIGAVAVVAAVVAGIGAAMLFNDGDSAEAGPPNAEESATEGGGQPSEDPDGGKQTKEPGSNKLPPKEDVATLRLEGGAQVDKATKGAKGKDGTYVSGMNTPGAAATWQTDMPKSGTYNLYVRYSVPGKDMHLSLGVNDKPHATGLDMKNYAKAKEGDWENGWTYTFSTVQVDEGSNAFKISCGEGDKCDVNLDQVWMKPAK